MNIKKYLQKQAEKDEGKLLTEADKLFCRQLAEQCSESERQKKPKKKKKRL